MNICSWFEFGFGYQDTSTMTSNLFNRGDEESSVEGNHLTNATSADLNTLETNDKQLKRHNTNPFLDASISEWWFSSYANVQYENIQYFNPRTMWERKEENRALRKLDLTVMIMVGLMFFGFQLNKLNLADAVRGGMAYDIDLDTYTYRPQDSGPERYFSSGSAAFGVALTISPDIHNILYAERACQIAFAIPSVLIGKKIGLHIWLPVILSIYCALGALCALFNSTSTAIGIRAGMGAVGAGFIPSCVLYLSYFYTANQLAMRLACLWVIKTIAEIFSGYLIFACVRIELTPGPWIMEGWRFLFLMEGVVPLAGTIIIAFFLPASLSQKHKWQREILTERQKEIQINSLLRDDPSKGLSNNHSFGSISEFVKSILDYDLYPIYFIALIAFIPFNTYETYLLLCIRRFRYYTSIVGYSFRMPWRITHMILLLSITKISQFANERTLISMIFAIWQLPLICFMIWWPGSIYSSLGSYIVCSLALAAPNIIAILQSWVFRNSASNTKRAISAALFMMFIDAGYMISSVIYKADYLPNLKRGSFFLFIIIIILILLLALTKLYYVKRNKSKLRKYNQDPQQSENLTANGWKGNKTEFFQFSH